MSIQQLSVFTQSEPGHLQRIVDLLQQQGISVRGFSCSDTGDYGIVRLVVNNPSAAEQILAQAGMATTTTEVIALKLVDVPGELARVFTTLANAGINVIYGYSLIATYIAIKVEAVTQAEALLRQAGVELISEQDLA